MTYASSVTVIPFDRQYQEPDGSLVDVKHVVSQLVAIEAQIDSLNKLKSSIYAEAKVLGGDVAALKSAVRIVGYVPESTAGNMAGLSEAVKAYLDIMNAKCREAN
jgi:hypothetical protein